MNSGFFQLQELAVPLAIAALIVLFSVLTFGVWSRRIRHTSAAAQALDAQLARADGSGHDAVRDAHTDDAALRFLLRETEAGLIDLPHASQGIQSTSFRPHADVWTVHNAVGARVNLALFETMPNLLIGFGLMCTFVFLAIALQQAGIALNAIDASARQQDQALQSLIATAGGKFITSIAGLLCSLVWNWRAKVALEKLQAALDGLCHTLRARIPDNAAEASMRLQIALFQDMLQEQRTQVGHLQRLESALARDLGESLSRNMQPAFDKLDSLASFEQTTRTLAEAMQGMRATVSELDGALARSQQVSQDGSAQMTQWVQGMGHSLGNLQDTLRDLDRAMGTIGQTAQSFENSARDIGQSVQLQRDTAEHFKASAAAMQGALDTVRTQLMDAQQALHGTVDALTQGVSAYSGQVAELHTKMDQHLAHAVNQLGGTITNLEEVLDEFIESLPPRQA
jgi:predicted  nucleic acid-binding Zn-ribbon protein/F0F1-type ATP synthase membrane subunit c/vacuolar-type H+-ATPase subunit K